MARSILRGQSTTTGVGSAAPSESRALSGSKLQQRLRQRRSQTYRAALSRLDAGDHLRDRAGLTALLQAITDEFPELGIDQRPVGIVSKCYLGPPYEVHICDLDGAIVEHFETFRSMPPLFERARALALHPAYAFIEIYVDAVRPVGHDGTVSVASQ